MWELDHKEGWAPKDWCFWTVVLEKTLESSLDCKEIQPVKPKGNQSWIFIGRTDLKLKLQYFGHLMWRSDSLEWILVLGRIGEGNGTPLQYSCLENPMDGGAWVGFSPWGREESDTTERLHFDFSLSCIAEGNGNPLQCSCLENPRDGGARWAAVYGVAQSRTWLKWLSSSSMYRFWT